jgi:Zn-dependent alcohol dehydrogenase
VPTDVPLETLAFLGCGMQTGAGSILNERPSRTPHRERWSNR